MLIEEMSKNGINYRKTLKNDIHYCNDNEVGQIKNIKREIEFMIGKKCIKSVHEVTTNADNLTEFDATWEALWGSGISVSSMRNQPLSTEKIQQTKTINGIDFKQIEELVRRELNGEEVEMLETTQVIGEKVKFVTQRYDSCTSFEQQ